MTPADLQVGSPSTMNWHMVLVAYSLTYIDRGITTRTLGLQKYPEGAALGLASVSSLTTSELYMTKRVLLLAISYCNCEWNTSSTDGPVKSDKETEDEILPAATSSDHSGGTNKTLNCPPLAEVVTTLQDKPLIWTEIPFAKVVDKVLSTLRVTTIPICEASGSARTRPLAGTGHA